MCSPWQVIHQLDVLAPGTEEVACLITLKFPDITSTEVTVKQEIESHFDWSRKAEELLVNLHGTLDEDPLLHLHVMVSGPIFTEEVSNVLGTRNPGQAATIQLN